MMKKKLQWVLMLSMILLLAACSKEKKPDTSEGNDTGQQTETVTVTFYDGDTVLKTEKVESGKTVTEYTPEKEGYEFLGWYATPSFSFEYDFSSPVTADVSIFSNWKSTAFTKDTRQWMLAGESAVEGALLNTNSWGKIDGSARIPFQLKQEKGTNQFTITLDLYQGDKFQIAEVDEAYTWVNQRGYGYVSESPEGAITGTSSPFGGGDLTANIEVALDGNYTLTLTTDVENPSLDTLTIVRNGDPTVSLEKSYLPNLSGTITGGTAIADKEALGDCGLTLNPENGLYETEISLNKGDYFSVLLNLNSWDVVLRTSQVDAEQSDPYYDKNDLANVTITEAGKYYVGVQINESEDTVSGSIILKKSGEFERTEGDSEVTFQYDASNIITAYVRPGARVPNPGDPNPQEGKVFLGWYRNLQASVPQAFTVPLTETGEVITLSPKFLGAEDKDTRSVFIKGSLNGWAGNDPAFQMEQTENHIYTFNLTAEAETQIMFTFYEGDQDTGATANGSIVDYDASTAKASGSGNITFSEAGTYFITFDTYAQKITITEAVQ